MKNHGVGQSGGTVAVMSSLLSTEWVEPVRKLRLMAGFERVDPRPELKGDASKVAECNWCNRARNASSTALIFQGWWIQLMLLLVCVSTSVVPCEVVFPVAFQHLFSLYFQFCVFLTSYVTRASHLKDSTVEEKQVNQHA